MVDSSALDVLRGIVDGRLTLAGAHSPDDLHDESLHFRSASPLAVARPHTTVEVAALARWATKHRVAITARGSGTGLSGGATPVDGGLVVAFDQMNRVLRVDANDHVAVVQAGVTLSQLNDALADTGLRYPVYPGEMSGSIGGNVATNAGGMRAVRHGVTRHHVLGLEVVTIDGTTLRTGGATVKSSSGYDLTQLLVGSEGTLALVCEATLKLSPRLEHHSTLLIPFRDVATVCEIVPRLIAMGLEPSVLEYLDPVTMASISRTVESGPSVPDDVTERAGAYLIVVLETRTATQLSDDEASVAGEAEHYGALDVYVLDGQAGARLLAARERAFWVAKAAGANDIVDIVVPRSSVATFLDAAGALADQHGAFIVGCGHVGDGNVHLSVYQSDESARERFLLELFRLGIDHGGAISGEHGLGTDKQGPYLALTDANLVDLQRRIKAVFDPLGLLNPHRHVTP